AALALLVRVAIGMGTIPPPSFQPGQRTAMKAAAAKAGEKTAALFIIADEPPKSPAAATDAGTKPSATAALQPVRSFTAELVGFVGKFAIFAALVDGYQKVESAGLPGFYLLLLLLVGGLNTAISLIYYLRVVKVMTIDDEPRDRPPLAFSDVSLGGAFLWVITLPTALLIVSWDWLSEVSLAAARNLLS